MNIQEIIQQEEKSFNAQKEVDDKVKQNKSEILLEFAMKIFDFLKMVQKDPKFVFTSQPHARDEDYSPLFSSTSLTLEYYKESVSEDIKKNAFARMMTRSFYYGSGGTRWIVFRIDDNFKPSVAFSKEMSPSKEETYYSTEAAIRVMTKFFLKHRKKS